MTGEMYHIDPVKGGGMRKTWRRARTDYPEGVIAIYDNGGKTVDRYLNLKT